MRLETTDLNLLVSLGALLAERNVTRAAERLMVSQPTMSAALRKLRAHFGDELLVRTQGRYELTPLAQDLSLEMPELLRAIERTFIERPAFDPRTATREFRILSSDLTTTVVAPRLVAAVAEAAPNARLSFERIRPLDPAEQVDQLLEVDLALMPDSLELPLARAEVFRDRWVCVGGRPRRSPLGSADLAAAQWVAVYGRDALNVFAANGLGEVIMDDARRVTVDSFLAVPWAVTGTDRLGLVQRQLFERVRRIVDIHEIAVEPELAAIREMAWWHPARASDSGHLWLRTLLTDLFAPATG
ncbi:LysR family transcriptional regulator [Leucobacter allii]|uniref:LysR family transcriptional regulator n=1 Tax=Leucobacter allii TaxID=2932247 RepID=A0ABY4FME0_9MICO|nr:LysR family transcriptional regulator [Leucobacter allii]UOQ57434.1 LysR family transcriptional regulator [Leucobacter allii]